LLTASHGVVRDLPVVQHANIPPPATGSSSSSSVDAHQQASLITAWLDSHG